MKNMKPIIDKNKAEPLYLQVENYLLGLISQGELMPDDRIPSEEMLSADFGISRMTARKALTNLETRGLIYRVPGKGTFINGKEKRLDKPVMPMIFIYLAPLNSKYHPYFLQMIEGIEHFAKLMNCTVIISSDLNSIYNYNSLLGVILIKRIPHMEIEKLQRHNIPFVLLYAHEQTYGRPYPAVVIDEEDAIFQETEYLLKLGHRRIALFTGILNGYLRGEGNRNRLKGYQHALEKYDVEFDNALVKESDYDQDKTILMMEQLISSVNPPTALIACDDIGAGFIINTLRENGLDVPGDMAVAGVGDLQINSLVHPPLTTVKYPIVEMGEKAIMLLAKMVKGESVQSPVYLKGSLLVRQSCGWHLRGTAKVI
jgi:DNA-binding LacI/PurR family transcriptional regulator